MFTLNINLSWKYILYAYGNIYFCCNEDSNSKESLPLTNVENTPTSKVSAKRLFQEVDIQDIVHIGDTQESSSKETKKTCVKKELGVWTIISFCGTRSSSTWFLCFTTILLIVIWISGNIESYYMQVLN